MKRFLKGLGIFLALVGVGIISAFAVVALLLRQEEIRVPDLIGQDIVTVVDMLPQLGLQPKIDRRDTSSTVPRDAVISQTPPGGSAIKKGRMVHVIVSLGPSDMQTPKLVGEHVRKADVMIRQAGYFPGNLSRISSDTVERDIVIGQDPTAGSQLNKGEKISLLISTGRRPAMLVTPNVIGKRAEEAATVISRLGLQSKVIYRTTSGAATDTGRTVIQQKPPPGSPVASDGTVEIVVSK